MLYNYINTSKFWASLDDAEGAPGLENHSAIANTDPLAAFLDLFCSDKPVSICILAFVFRSVVSDIL